MNPYLPISAFLVLFATFIPARGELFNNNCNDANIICVAPDGSGEYATIQAAINAATDDDEIVLCEGEFFEYSLSFSTFLGNQHTRLTIRSQDPASYDPDNDDSVVSNTVLKGNYTSFVFENSVPATIVIDGITIQKSFRMSILSGSSPTIRRSILENANDPHGVGGAIEISGGSTPWIDRCTIRNNVVSSESISRGGGIYINASDPDISGCLIEGNSLGGPGSTREGAGIYILNGSPEIWDTVIRGNGDTTGEINYGYGGGVAVAANAEGTTAPVFRRCTISDNAALRGGGLHFEHFSSQAGSLAGVVENSMIAHNRALNGGGFWVVGSSTTFLNSMVVDNMACGSECDDSVPGGTGQGGGFRIEDGAPVIEGCTIAGNWAWLGGGGICAQAGGTATSVRNTILWGNKVSVECFPTGIGAQISITSDDQDGCVDIDYSVVQGGDGAILGNTGSSCPEVVIYRNNNRTGDPLMVNPIGASSCSTSQDFEGADFHLGSFYPSAFEGGDSGLVGGTETDIDAGPRIAVSEVDIGADEIINCNGNNLPDVCDLNCGPEGGPCDVEGCGQEQDCNTNNVPDSCDVDPNDPDWNGLVSNDCDDDGVPDECQEDCNGNGFRDLCEVAASTGCPGGLCEADCLADCDEDCAPDTCQSPDCNGNDVSDHCDIAADTSEDFNTNGIPDECEAIHVWAAGNGEDGRSWETAFNNLQDALAAARGCDSAYVWVAEGSYMPDGGRTPIGETHVKGSESRTATFQLRDNLEIYGGFQGDANPPHTRRAQRNSDPETNQTTLSGDILGDDAEFVNNGENSYHVVTGSGTDMTAILDGFSIRGGNESETDGAGGGMLNVNGNPVVRNCRFYENKADEGGGMHNNASNPTVEHCKFLRNEVTDRGGGMFNVVSAPTLSDCKFEDNTATNAGGGLHNESAVTGQNPPPLELSACTFVGNSATLGGGMYLGGSSYAVNATRVDFSGNTGRVGGGVYLKFPSATFTLCKFLDNEAQSLSYSAYGGGAWIATDAGSGGGGGQEGPVNQVDFINCLFGRNEAKNDGGGLYFSGEGSTTGTPNLLDCTFGLNEALAGNGEGGGLWFYDDSPVVTNSIFWGNTDAGGTHTDESAQIHDDWTGSVTVTYTDWQGHTPGQYEYNLNADPKFHDPSGNTGTADDDFHIDNDSPCLDVGNNSAVPQGLDEDLDHRDRILNGYVDLGAYEGKCGAFDCGDLDQDYIIDDACTWYECVADVCDSTDRIYADMGSANGPGGRCHPDGSADSNDRFHVLNCFANENFGQPGPYPCATLNVDVAGAPDPYCQSGTPPTCCPDGTCDMNDYWAASRAFAGMSDCFCPSDHGICEGGANDGDPCWVANDCPNGQCVAFDCCQDGYDACTPPCEEGMQGAMGFTSLALNSVVRDSGDSVADVVVVDVFLDAPMDDLKGYQLHLGVSGGTAGQLELIEVRIEDRDDYVFTKMEYWQAFNVHTQQMMAGLDGDGIATGERLYLATFVFKPTAEAAGDFVVDVLPYSALTPDYRTFVFRSGGLSLPVGLGTPAVLDVTSP